MIQHVNGGADGGKKKREAREGFPLFVIAFSDYLV